MKRIVRLRLPGSPLQGLCSGMKSGMTGRGGAVLIWGIGLGGGGYDLLFGRRVTAFQVSLCNLPY